MMFVRRSSSCRGEEAEMKKVLLTIGIILVALAVIAPAPEKAEKLKFDQNDWDRENQQFVVSMLCKFGIATAGEHADFTTKTTLTVDTNTGGDPYTLTASNGISKVEGAEKDADGYIAIEPTTIAWDPKGFTDNAKVTASVSLVGPSGTVQGDPVVVTEEVKIEGPPPVKFEDNEWDYEPEYKEIVVPLLADPNIVDKKYTVVVNFTMTMTGEEYQYGSKNPDLYPTFIELKDDIGGEYVRIKPVYSIQIGSLEWNGDDDGSGIISGTVDVFKPGDGGLHDTFSVENLKISFLKH
jgi:hypothetical protein